MDILIGQIASAVQLQGFISGEEQLKGSFDLFTLPEHQYEGSYLITPTESEQVLPTSGRTPLGNIAVEPIPEQYIVPSGTITITENGTEDVTQYASASVDVQPSLQDKSVTVTSAGNTDITADASYYGLSTATAFVPSGEASQGTQFGYTSSGTRWRMREYNNVTSAGWFESGQTQGAWASFYAVPSGTTITPTESSQTVGGDDYMMQGAVTVNAIPSDYVGTSIPRYSSSDIYPDTGYTVVTPSGYYESDGVFQVPYETHTAPSISYDSSGLITATHYQESEKLCIGSDLTSNTLQIEDANFKITLSTSYYTDPIRKWSVSPNWTVSSNGWLDSTADPLIMANVYPAVPSGTVVTPSTSSQTIGGANHMMEDAVTVSPIPSQYIVPSGTISISSNGTVDVTQYASASVNVPAPSPSLQLLAKEYTPSDTEQIFFITPSAGYDGLSEVDVTVKAISPYYVGSSIPRMSSANLTASGSTVTAPSGYYSSTATKNISSGSATVPDVSQTSATVTTGTNTLTLTKTVSLTPTVSAGYISSGTARNASIKLTGTVTTQSASTYYPSTADQTITSRYLTGTQTFKGVTTSNLTAGNIKSGVVVQVGDSADSDRILSVTGTYSGGGGDSKNAQTVQGTTRTTSSTLTAIGAEMTVSKTGTYDVYWSGFRSTTSGSYTYGTQLYINGTAYGTQNTTWSNHVQNNHLSNVSLTQDDKIRVYGRNSRGSSYYIYAPTLVIIEV